MSRLVALTTILAVLAVLLLAAAPFGWRAGLWHYRISFELIAGADLLALIAGIAALLCLAVGRRRLGRRATVAALCVVLVGAAFALMSWQTWQRRGPPIHDITTDTDHPPAIVAALAARQAEHAATADYGGTSLAQQQKEAYPDIAPLVLSQPPARAYDLALATATAMPGWHILATDAPAGRIEATQASFWFGFTDDIVIRVSAEGVGSRVDMRSLSRQGRGDLGVNAARVRAYLAALKQKAGASEERAPITQN